MKFPTIQLTFMALTLTTLGCSASKDEIAKQLEEMKQEVTAIRASNSALRDRLDALEEMPSSTSVGREAAAEEGNDRPSLEVVHLTPEEDLEPAATVVAPIDNRPAVDIVGDKNGVNQLDATDASDPKAKTGGPGAKKK
jgi:hypothetical protein